MRDSVHTGRGLRGGVDTVHRRHLVAAVVVLTGLTVALYAYDSGRGSTIAQGVRIGSVDVGGLSPHAARVELRRRYLEPLKRPIVVRWHARTWELGAREARIAVNVDALVDEAVARSGDGGMIRRSWRRLTGGRVPVQLEPRITYSDAAIVRTLDKVRASVGRGAVDASLRFTGSGFSRNAGSSGLAVDAARLHRQIREAIVRPDARRRLRAQTRTVRPKITESSLASVYGTVLIVDRAKFQLKLYKRLKLVKRYAIGVGMQGLETPAGLYHIQNKSIDPAWNVPIASWTGSLAGKIIPGGAPDNPLKARWLGIFDGAGIHGIDPSEYATIGTAASHGCVRMRISDVKALYPDVPVGSPIYIA